MPYKKVKGHSECERGEIAVVAPSGKVVGCHDTEQSADSQIAALMAKEDNTSRWVDQYSADRVLSGEPVLLMPVMPGGYHRWGSERDPITEVTLQAMLANFDKRAQIPGLVANVPLNIEHDEMQGKIGSIIKLELGEGGLYAYFDLTARGTELLESGAFDYLSPEVVWDFEDIQSGQSVGPVIVGAAVTNYPFFGEATAMYSDRAARAIVDTFSMKEEPGDETGEVLDYVMEAYRLVQDLGFRHSDLDQWAESPIRPLGKLFTVLGKDRRVQHHFTLAICRAQPGGDGHDYPPSAYLETDSEPWRYRVKAYDPATLKLQYDRRLVQQVYAEMQESEPGLLARHAAIFEWNVEIEQEGTSMSGTSEQVVSQEDFAALREQAESHAKMIDQLTAQVAERDSRLEAMRQERVVETFSREAEQFSALGIAVDEYATHMAWLASVDTDEEHLEWFRVALSTADKALAQSDAFRSKGTGEQAPAGSDPFSRIQSLMKVKATERGVVLKIGTDPYNEIMTEVMNENPKLMEMYRAGLVAGGSEPPAD